MKKILSALLVITTFGAMAQSAKTFVHYNMLTDIAGTPFVIGSITSGNKMGNNQNAALTFVNTQTGITKKIDLPAGSLIGTITQVKLDSLGINKILVSARTQDVNGKKAIDWGDPQQLFLFSPGGESQVQLTPSAFFATHQQVNRTTGTVVVTGFYDTNKNDRQDATDESTIMVFSLQTGKRIGE